MSSSNIKINKTKEERSLVLFLCVLPYYLFLFFAYLVAQRQMFWSKVQFHTFASHGSLVSPSHSHQPCIHKLFGHHVPKHVGATGNNFLRMLFQRPKLVHQWSRNPGCPWQRSAVHIEGPPEVSERALQKTRPISSHASITPKFCAIWNLCAMKSVEYVARRQIRETRGNHWWWCQMVAHLVRK